VIRLELESRVPRLVGSYATDGDLQRLSLWLEGQPQLLALLTLAQEIAEEPAA
jgi:hypothetical protein